MVLCLPRADERPASPSAYRHDEIPTTPSGVLLGGVREPPAQVCGISISLAMHGEHFVPSAGGSACAVVMNEVSPRQGWKSIT